MNVPLKTPFNKPFLVGKELAYIEQAVKNGRLSGNGPYTRSCHSWLEKNVGTQKALLTHSCTAALEMAALLCDIQPGDEVIMPSYTFVSTANAFVIRGAKPVFVDIREDTLNLDERKIGEALSANTKMIVPVHYAGYPCEMDSILDIAEKNGLFVVEDAAQALLSTDKDRGLGSIGHLGCLSFHETKNIISGEGGALLINDPKLMERAEIIWEKGTNRSKFYRGEVDKYTWVDVGSSYLPSELTAAFLFAQLEQSERITKKRIELFDRYFEAFGGLQEQGHVILPRFDKASVHNGHIFYMLLETGEKRDALLNYLKSKGILAVFHYVPLHSSPAGQKWGRAVGDMKNTDNISSRLVRLPLFYEMSPPEQDNVIAMVLSFFANP